MSVVCGAIRKGRIAIASDSQFDCESVVMGPGHLKSANKLFAVNGSVIGLVGWQSISLIIEHLINNKPELFRLNGRTDIFDSLLTIHKLMKELYYVETREDEGQPVESNHINAIVINKQGLFGVASYREVSEYNTYWAVGAGQSLALGAMHAVYNQVDSATAIVNAGVSAACEFEESCCGPIQLQELELEL